jgi:hypothetical protein
VGKRAALIAGKAFLRERAGFFPSGKRRLAIPARMRAGLPGLRHACQLSDAAVVACRGKPP